MDTDTKEKIEQYDWLITGRLYEVSQYPCKFSFVEAEERLKQELRFLLEKKIITKYKVEIRDNDIWVAFNLVGSKLTRGNNFSLPLILYESEKTFREAVRKV